MSIPTGLRPSPQWTQSATRILGTEQSQLLWEHLKYQGLMDSKGRVQDSLREAIKHGTLEVLEPIAEQLDGITEVLRKLTGRLDIKNADERRPVRHRQAILHSDEFRALWGRIKHKTTYREEFDDQKLLQRCIQALKSAPPIAKTRLEWRKAGLAIGKGGVEVTEVSGAATVVLDEADILLTDVLTDLQDRTQITRRSIHSVLVESGRLADFKRNPQQCIELAAEAINRCKRLALVDGIKYQRLGDEHYYAQEFFEPEELTGYLKNMLEETRKSVYEHVVYDSDTERSFADQLENSDAVRVHVKLPGWFKVPTPLGSYNPEWAVLLRTEDGERLYLVVETKGGLFANDLRVQESAKIACGKAHFGALRVGEAPAEYVVARSFEDVPCSAGS